ncbi:amidohydrolase family protein [Phenylobacterium sp.]|jgi:imidazolonepropionase-like amidohydrolase|uniref:amidohydrolase family protein n=1 Tax=Phenylobacterium sp. TaxID=1871053 RepID=UPI002F94548A
MRAVGFKLAALAAALWLGGSSPSLAQPQGPVALVGATIVDGNGGAPIPDGVVLLRGDRIEAVGPRASVRLPRNARVVDVRGKWITPGLIDAHVHFFQSGGLYTRPDGMDLTSAVPYAEDLARSKSRLDETFARYLASGVTTVVDAGGPKWNFEVRSRAAASPRAPRVAVAGPLIATEPTVPQKKLDLGDPPIISAADPGEAAALARALLPAKPDLIKIWGIGSGPEGARRLRDMTAAVVAVAKPAGIRVAVHATDLEQARAAVEGGAEVLVHSVDDAPVDDAFVAALKARGVVYVTTVMVGQGYSGAFTGRPALTVTERRLGAPDIIATLSEIPPAIAAQVKDRMPDATPQILANAKRVHAAGVRVAAGTDAGNVGTLHGPAIHRELELLVAAGLTPSQALTAATRDAAYAYAPKPDIGLVAAGYRADLLVLNADPTRNVSALARFAQVWSRGVSHGAASLIPESPEALVQRQLEAYNAHDLEAFAATYAEDIEIFDLPGAAAGRTGKAALRETYGPLFQRLPQLRCEAAHRVVEGPFVIDQEVCRPTPQARPRRATAIYQVENGRIRRVWFAAAP